MTRGGRLWAIVVVLLAMVTSRTAAAAVVGDANFTIDVSGATICFIEPIALRDASACEGLHPETVTRGAEKNVLASGVLRVPGDPSPGLFTLTVVPDAPNQAIDPSSAREVAKGFTKGMLGTLPAGARATEPDVRVVHAGGVDLARITFDVHGLPAQTALLFEHQVHYLVPTRDGAYTVSWTTHKASAATVEALGDAAIGSTKVTHHASRKSFAYQLGYLFGFGLGILIVVVIVVVAVVIGTRRKAPPPPPPPPWQGYGPGGWPPRQG